MPKRWFRERLDAGMPAPLELAVNERGELCAVSFVAPGVKGSLESHAAKRGASLEAAAKASEAGRALLAYARGEVDHPQAARDMGGTPFQAAVWAAVAEIPAGTTATYGEIARAIGNPTAVRAVGAANGQNPIPIFVPCHRVIGSDGGLTGYASGLEIKRWLLAHEQRQGDLFGGLG